MMTLLDENLEFVDNAALTTTTGTNNEGDVVDSDVARNLGIGQVLYLVIQITTTFTTATSAEVAFQLVSDSTGTIATDGNQTIHVKSDALDTSVLVAGKQLVFALPAGDVQSYEQFLGIQAVVTSAALTAGAINAFLTLDPGIWVSHADAAN